MRLVDLVQPADWIENIILFRSGNARIVVIIMTTIPHHSCGTHDRNGFAQKKTGKALAMPSRFSMWGIKERAPYDSF
jgi:hypothetical protein